MRMESRLNPEEYWMGTVTLVDYENPIQGNGNSYYANSDSDEMSASSRYPFYVELDSSDGLILGQHLYLSVASETVSLEGVTLGGAFVCYDEEGNCFVWAENGQGKLEKRAIELGNYDMMSDAYEILSGLEEDDFVAFPDEAVCVEGAPTTRQEQKGGTGE